MQVHSYENPTNHCPQCYREDPEARNCCDNFSDNMCIGHERCDNTFFYCVRPIGTPVPTQETLFADDSIEAPLQVRASALQCMQSPSAFRSDTNVDGGFVDYSGPTFLGLPNPMEFHVEASKWEVSEEPERDPANS